MAPIALIPLDVKTIKACAIFAENSANTSNGIWGSKLDTAVENIFTGKLGEWGVYGYLVSLGYFPEPPDTKIYRGKQKSFTADIACEGMKVHVKTQTADSAEQYGISWILQHAENRKDKLFKAPTPEDYFFGCVLGDEDGELLVEIYVAEQWLKLIDNNLIELPHVAWLHATKRAVYAKAVRKRLGVSVMERKEK